MKFQKTYLRLLLAGVLLITSFLSVLGVSSQLYAASLSNLREVDFKRLSYRVEISDKIPVPAAAETTKERRLGGKTPAVARNSLSSPKVPSLFDLLSLTNLNRNTTYCTYSFNDRSDKWQQNYLCEVKYTDVIIGFSALTTALLTGGLLIFGMVQIRVISRQNDTMKQQVLTMTAQSALMSRQIIASEEATKFIAEQTSAAKASVPRSWLYVEFDSLTDSNIPLSIRNYGAIPATIKELDLRVFVGGFENGSLFEPEQELVTTPFEVGEIGGVTAPVLNAIEMRFPFSRFIFDGRNVAPNQSVPDEPLKGRISVSYPAFKGSAPHIFLHRIKYVRVIVRYNDPSGNDRETRYLGELVPHMGIGIAQINDPRYSYHV